MAETIGSSPDPDRPPRRITAVVAGGLLAVAVTVAAVAQRHSSHDRAGPTPSLAAPRVTSVASGPTQTPPYAPPVSRPALPSAALACDRCDPVLRAPVRTSSLRARLLVGGPHLSIVVTATGRSTTVPLPVDRRLQVDDLVPLGRGAAVLVGPRVSGPADPPQRVYLVDAAGRARSAGRADFLVPGPGGTCWLETAHRGPGTGRTALVQLDGAGRAIARMWVPGPDQVVAGTPYGMLVQAPGQPGIAPAPIEIVAADGQTLLLEPDGAVALTASGSAVAWSRPDGSVAATDITAAATPLGHPGKPVLAVADTGAFSPDGRHLAVAVEGLPQLGSGSAYYGYLEVRDVHGVAIRRIGGIRIPPKQLPGLGWLDDHTLAIELRFGDSVRIALWDSRTGQTTALPGTVPGAAAVPELRVVTLRPG